MASRLREVILPLCSSLIETPAGLLCPVLGPPAQDRHGPVRAGPEEGSGETIWWPFNTERELKRKMEKDFLSRPVVTGQGAMFLN